MKLPALLSDAFAEPTIEMRPFRPPRGHAVPAGLPHLPGLLLFVALFLPPSPTLRTWFFLPVIIGVTSYCVFWCGADNKASSALDRGLSPVTMCCRAIELLAAWMPEKDYSRSDGRKTPADFTLSKASWAADLMINNRGVGWKWRSKSLPLAPKSQSRAAYILRHLRFVGITAIVLDFGAFVNSYNAYYLSNTAVSRWDTPLFHQLTGSIWPAISARFILEAIHGVLGILFVALRISEPADWPPLFGPLSSLRSVRGFWSSFWHQMMRRSFLAVTKVLKPFFPHSDSSHFVILIAFGCSAILHACQNFALSGQCSYTVLFFILQPFALLLEDVISPHLQRLLPKTGGYLWTVVWLGATSTLMWHDQAANGLFNEVVIPPLLFPRSQSYLKGNGML